LQAAIQYAPYVLQAFDADAAGDEGASWWQATIQNCVRLAPVWAKDVNEMLVGQIDICDWIQDGINNAVSAKSDSLAVERSSTSIDDTPTEVAPVCVVCSAIVDSYTDQGTPCCEKHYGSQQTIEKALAKLAEETVEKVPSSDPLDQFASTIDKIADVFAPCTVVRHDPNYTLQDHVDFMVSEEKRAQIAKQIAMSQMVRDRQYNRLHTEE